MRDILNSYTTTELRKHISKFNKSLGLVKGYSKMKKAELVDLMTKKENINKFKSIKMKPKPDKKEVKKPVKKTEEKKTDNKKSLNDFKKLLIDLRKEMNEKNKTLLNKKNIETRYKDLKSVSEYLERVSKAIKLFFETSEKKINVYKAKLPKIDFNKAILGDEYFDDRKQILRNLEIVKTFFKNKYNEKKTTTTKTATKTTTKTQPKKEPKKETPKQQPKKEQPKKETPKKPKEQPKKEEPKKQTSGMLKATVKRVKPGDKGFVKDFKILTKAQQLDAMKNQIVLTGSPPNAKWYQDNADKFYSGVFTLLNKSASRAIPEIINNYQLTFEDLKNIYFGQTKGTAIDFFPTPDKCIKELYDALPSAFKRQNITDFELLEGTAGIGNVSNWFSKNTNYNVVSNELNPNLFKIMNKFLPDKVKTLNKDFFNLDVGRTINPDVIFLNPPFGEKNNKLWFKFLLKGFQYLKDSKNRNTILLFIAPQMFRLPGSGRGHNFSNVKDFIKGYDKGTVPIGKAMEYINDVFNQTYTLKEYKNVIDDNINTEDEEELNDFFEFELNFDIGEIVNGCEGFGGTGVRTQLALIQYIK